MSGELLAAFDELFLARGYSGISVRLVCARAGVARSTFYECFTSKSDILRQSIQPIFAILAACVLHKRCPDRLAAVLKHMQEKAKFARALMRGPVRGLVVGFLADVIQPGAALTRTQSKMIAAAQLSILEVWLDVPAPSDSQGFAKVFFQSSRALAQCVSAGNYGKLP